MKEDPSPYFEKKSPFFPFQNNRWLTAALACVAGLAVLVVYLQSAPKPEAYLAAEAAIAKWEASRDEASFQEMKRALKKVPALEKKYEATLAQKLFEGDQLSKALSIAHRSILRVEKDVPFHATYGETSLLIEQGSYQDALERSVALKKQMDQSLNWGHKDGDLLVGGELLYAHNLLRIAFLQQELHNKPGERAAWEELESFLQAKERLASLVFGNFREKGLDLADYIAERKKHL